MDTGTEGRKSPPTRMTRTARGFAVALAFVGGTPAVVAQEAPARTSQIYQHRTADGRIVLSDRPVAGAQLQRTWNIANEDTAAARERSEKGRLEAQAVSERIQRSIDSQRRADDEAQRMRLAYAQLERDRAAAQGAQDGIGYGAGYAGGYGWPTPFRASRKPGLPVGDTGVMDPTGTRGEGVNRGGHAKPKGSGSRGNRSR